MDLWDNHDTIKYAARAWLVKMNLCGSLINKLMEMLKPYNRNDTAMGMEQLQARICLSW